LGNRNFLTDKCQVCLPGGKEFLAAQFLPPGTDGLENRSEQFESVEWAAGYRVKKSCGEHLVAGGRNRTRVDVDANPNHHTPQGGSDPGRFDKNSGALLAVQKDVVGPFDFGLD